MTELNAQNLKNTDIGFDAPKAKCCCQICQLSAKEIQSAKGF